MKDKKTMLIARNYATNADSKLDRITCFANCDKAKYSHLNRARKLLHDSKDILERGYDFSLAIIYKNAALEVVRFVLNSEKDDVVSNNLFLAIGDIQDAVRTLETSLGNADLVSAQT